MSESKTQWSWPPIPRNPAPALGGDVEGAAAYLRCDEARLAYITAMICSGIPDGKACKARWSQGPSRSYFLEVLETFGQLRHEFIQTADGLQVRFDLLVLPEGSHHKGNAKRIFRNLAHVYDEFQVLHVSVFADHGNGAFTWAKLGAKPIDPDLQRKRLSERLRQIADEGHLDDDDRDEMLEIIRDTDEDVLMYEVARTRTKTVDVGRLLLVGYDWNGYWDLADPKLPAMITGAVA